MEMETDEIQPEMETDELHQNLDDAEIVTHDMILNRINSLLSHRPLNIKKDDYCYIRIVGHHLEIGRAKIILEE